MADWNGAQYLIIFMMGMRALVGAAVWHGTIVFPKREQTPRAYYFSKRAVDLTLLAILYWGGFF